MGSRFNPSVDLGRNAPASTPPVTPLFTSHLRINFQVLRQTSEEDMGIHHHRLSFNRPMMKKGYHSSRPSSCRALGTEYVQRAPRHGKVQTVLEYTGTCIVHISKPTALVTRVAPPLLPPPHQETQPPSSHHHRSSRVRVVSLAACRRRERVSEPTPMPPHSHPYFYSTTRYNLSREIHEEYLASILPCPPSTHLREPFHLGLLVCCASLISKRPCFLSIMAI